MKLLCALAVLVVLVIPSLGDYARTVSYKGDIVLRCPDRTKSTVNVLRKHADVFHVGADQSIDLRLSQKSFESVERYFPECKVVIEDLEEHVRTSEERMVSSKEKLRAWAQQVMEEMVSEQGVGNHKEALSRLETKLLKDTWFEDYHDYSAIVQWYKEKAAEYPNLVTFVPSIGTTNEGRDMPAVHITAASKKGGAKIYLQSLIHAREWITGAVLMYSVDHLLTNYGKDPEVTKILDTAEIIAVPIVNPDGYAYTWTNDRLWRKNRVRTTSESDCVGVDINRNFPEGWSTDLSGKDVVGASADPCKEDYRGLAPASEKEVNNIMAYFKLHTPIVGAIDIHSYGQLVLRPYGYINDPSTDESKLSALGEKLVEAMKKSTGQKYTSQLGYDLYQANGIASDWFYSEDAAKENKGIRAMGYTIELRDDGNNGFLLPASEIIATGQEFTAALKTFAKYTTSNPIYLSSSSSSSHQRAGHQ